jgi:sulfur carrier protein ThiS
MMDVLVSSADTGTSEETHFANVIDSISLAVSTNIEPPATFNNTRLSELMTVVTTDVAKQTSVSDRLAALNTEINKIATAVDVEAVNAQLKAAEVVSQLVKKEATGSDTDAAKKVLDAGIDSLSTTLLTTLTDDTVEFDITSITNTLVDSGQTAVDNDTDFDENVIEDAVNDAKLATGTTWGGQWFVLEASDGDSDDLAAGSYLAIKLDGTAESTGGRLAVCVNVSAADSSDPEDSIVNEYIGGNWSKISDGAVVLNLDYEGQQFEGKMKAKVLEDGDTQQQFRFTTEIDGATESGDLLLDANGVSALANVAKPSSSADCANNVDTQL